MSARLHAPRVVAKRSPLGRRSLVAAALAGAFLMSGGLSGCNNVERTTQIVVDIQAQDPLPTQFSSFVVRVPGSPYGDIHMWSGTSVETLVFAPAPSMSFGNTFQLEVSGKDVISGIWVPLVTTTLTFVQGRAVVLPIHIDPLCAPLMTCVPPTATDQLPTYSINCAWFTGYCPQDPNRCVDVSREPQRCGNCNTACGGLTPNCVAGVCVP